MLYYTKLLTLTYAGPSPPIDIQSLCNVVVWGTSLNPNGDITGYEAQFYIPGTEVALLKEIAQDRTFYIVEEEDKLSKPLNVLVRVCIIIMYRVAVVTLYAGVHKNKNRT